MGAEPFHTSLVEWNMDSMYDQTFVLLRTMSIQGVLDYCYKKNAIVLVDRKYLGQIYTDSLVHDETGLKYLVDIIGEVILVLSVLCSCCILSLG